MSTSAVSIMRRAAALWLALSLLALAGGAAMAAPKLVLATVDWEPHYGSSLKNQGYFSEITRQAFAKVHYDVEIKFVPWKRALHDVKNGYYDGLMGAYYSDERAEWLEFSDPVADVQLVFFARKGSNISYDSLQDLKKYKIGVIRGYVHTDEFDKAAYLQKEEAKDLDTNLKKLLKGRIDILPEVKAVMLHHINTKYPELADKLEVVGRPLSINRMYNGITKTKRGHEIIMKDFNRALEDLRVDGAYQNILRVHGF